MGIFDAIPTLVRRVVMGAQYSTSVPLNVGLANSNGETTARQSFIKLTWFRLPVKISSSLPPESLE